MSEEYIEIQKTGMLPRLPLEGSFDPTYRCNNNCRHCWLRIPLDAGEKKDELSFEEIKRIVDEAKKAGCREWSISGGEPMVRQDFFEIFDYITSNCISYTLNTNGTLVTPKIARLMKRIGSKMVALYGATAEVHDYITRNPGSFELTMRGFAYLKEAGAGFVVQIIPMKDNYHQFKEMIDLAYALSKHHRIGASWLHLSAHGAREINEEILRERLSPEDVVKIDKPGLSFDYLAKKAPDCKPRHKNKKSHFFSLCLLNGCRFYIDPYGKMAFCSFIKEPTFFYDLRKGDFNNGWENFIPSLPNKFRVTQEYRDNCGCCEFRRDCRWCPAYGYLEHRRFSAKIEYLCAVAKEVRRFKEDWYSNHRRYYRIADITIRVDADLPITDDTFGPKFKLFEVNKPGNDIVTIRHHFSLPELNASDLGRVVYRKPPWVIYKKGDSWIYLRTSSIKENNHVRQVAVFDDGHTHCHIYNSKDEPFLKGNLVSLTLLPTDQILLAQVLADRQGCYLHSCGVNFEGNGLLFIGHSEAGKSTIARLLRDKAEILCDDRMIIRGYPDGFRIYGTWSHGDVKEVSAHFANLKAILFLEKSQKNYFLPIEDKKEIVKQLVSCVIKPLVTSDWWKKTLSVIEKISQSIPCYALYFDKSGRAADLLRTVNEEVQDA